MHKGITPVAATVLLLLITISVTGVSFVFFQRTAQTSAQSAEQQLSNQAEQMGNTFSIEGVDKNKVYLRNRGAKSLNANSLNFYVNNVLVESNDIIIATGTIGAVALNDSKLAMLPDPAELKVTSVSSSDRIIADFYGKYTVGYWRFDDDAGTIAKDSSGNGNDGNLLPAGSGPQWVAGKSGNALSFDGINDYVSISDSTSLDIDNAITMEAWINLKEESSWTNRPGIVFKLVSGIPRTGYAFYILGKLETAFGTNGGKTHYGPSSNSVISLNEWHHVAAVRNGTEVKFYINGVLDKTTWIKATGSGGWPPDVYSLYQASNGDIYIAGDGNLYKSSDNGTTWIISANKTALDVDEFYFVSELDNDDLIMATGSTGKSNLYRSTDNGATWINITNGDLIPDGVYGGETLAEPFSFLQARDGSLYFAGSVCLSPRNPSLPHCSGSRGDVYKSTDNGASWTRVANGATDLRDSYHNWVIIQLANNDILVGTMARTGYASIYKTSDGGTTWTKLVGNATDFGRAGHIFSILQTANGNIFAGTGSRGAGSLNSGNVYKSSDNGLTWVKAADSTADLGGANEVRAIFQASNDDIYVGTSPQGNIYKSADNGVSWTKIADGVNNLDNATVVWDFLQTSNGILFSTSNPAGDIFRLTGSYPWGTNNQNLLIGYTWSADAYFNGTIDEVRILNVARGMG